MKLEFYHSNPGSTPGRVKKPTKKPPCVPVMTKSRKAYLKMSKKIIFLEKGNFFILVGCHNWKEITIWERFLKDHNSKTREIYSCEGSRLYGCKKFSKLTL